MEVRGVVSIERLKQVIAYLESELISQGEKLTQKIEQLRQSIPKAEHEKIIDRMKREYESRLSEINSCPVRTHNERGAGRKPKVTDDVKAKVLELYMVGLSQSKIAKALSDALDMPFSRSTVGSIVRSTGQPRDPPEAAPQGSKRQF